MLNTDVWFGAALYMRIDPDASERCLRRILIDSDASAAKLGLRYLETVAVGSDRPSRQRKAAPGAIQDVLRRWRGGSLKSIAVRDRRTSVYVQGAFLQLRIDLLTGGDLSPRQSLRLTGPRESYKQEEVSAWLRKIVVEFEADYGFVLTGIQECVLDLVSFTPVVWPSWSIDTPNPTVELADEMAFYSSRTSQLGGMIPRANWGNILSPVHVSGLGGEERVRKESNCFLVERWGRNLYLQLTESPWDVPKERLISLNKYFEPIRFPGAPEPVYW